MKKTVRQRAGRLFRGRLRNQLILLLAPVVILAFALISVIAYNYVAGDAKTAYIDNARVQLRTLGLRESDYFDQLNGSVLSLYSDVLFSEGSYSGEAGVYNYKLRKLQEIYIRQEETDSVLLYLPGEEELYVVNARIDNSFGGAGGIERTDWYKAAAATDRLIIEPAGYLTGYDPDYHMTEGEPVFSLVRNIHTHGQTFGVLCINYRLDALRAMMAEHLADPTAGTLLLDEEGRLLCATDPAASGAQAAALFELAAQSGDGSSFTYRDEHSGTLLVLVQRTGYGHTLLQTVPMGAVLARARQMRTLILTLGAVSVLVLVSTIVLVSVRITRPLEQVEEGMREIAAGNFEVEIPCEGDGEVGRIARTCVFMKDKIRQLINEEYRMKLKYRDAQFEALQAQINPHFLSNALQCIGSAAYEQGAREVEPMTKALADMLRYSISAKAGTVPLAREAKNVEDYLKIQKFRFETRIEYAVDLPENCRELAVPRLILQPLVENAIVHGAEPNRQTTMIRVSCRLENGRAELAVWDDGVGAAPAELEALRASLARPAGEAAQEGHIGLRNVAERMRLVYGGGFAIRLDAVQPHGFEVRLRFLTEAGEAGG